MDMISDLWDLGKGTGISLTKCISQLTIVLILMAHVAGSQVIDSAQWKTDSIRRITRAKFNDLYILNSELSNITFGEQGHPQGRQYILNGNIVPHYYCFPAVRR